MYVHPAFKVAEQDALAFARERAFGAVIAVDGDRPVAAHVPFLMRERDGGLWLEAHVAKANPLHEVIASAPRVLVIVSGADAYISPDWYVSEDQAPTWNYAAVHLSGIAHVMPSSRAHAHVDALSLAHEQRLKPKTPWRTSKMSERRLATMLAAIVAFEVRIDKVEAAFKLGQNKSATDAQEVARMLAWRGSPNETAVARAMRARIKLEEPA